MIYLLHASKPVGTIGRGAAQHYLGWCRKDALDRRLSEHRSGRSNVPVVKAFLRAGAKLYVARLWHEGTRDQEVRMKQNGHLDRFCPICNGDETATAAMEEQLCLPL